MRRSWLRRRDRDLGPAPVAVELVLARDDGRCVHCGRRLTGQRGDSWSLHHRVGRGMGGSRVPWMHLPANLLSVCGRDNATGCHGHIHRYPLASEVQGLIVPRGLVLPAQVPVTTWRGCLLLDDRGGYAPAAAGVSDGPA